MCTVSVMDISGRSIKVADIKKKYMLNIVDAASKCDIIDRVILFGSSIEERCTEDSDIDIAVFGKQNPSRVLSSKKYERFARQLYAYDNHNQGYDILYFKQGTKSNSPIMESILRGEVIYEREQQ